MRRRGLPSFPLPSALPVRSVRLFAAACAVGVSALAIAGTVVYDDNTDWDAPRDLFLNLVDSGGGPGAVLELAVVEDLDATGGWYRQPWDGASYAFEVQKDDTALFAGIDPCVLDAANAFSDTDTVTVNGTQYRAGLASGGAEEATLPSGTVLSLPEGGTVDELRFLTSGARVAESTYTLTFFYADATSADVVVPIPLDADVDRTRAGTDFTVADWAGAVTTVGGDCAASGGNEVIVSNPNPGLEVTEVAFTFDESPTATGWLAGPLALTVFSDQATLEAMFAYRGTFQSTTTAASTALDAGGAALWTDVSWVATFADGSEIDLFLACGDDADGDGALEASELGLEQGPFPLSEGTSVALGACRGRYAVYRLEYYAEFDPGTAPFLDAITFTYDPDSDGDGDPDSSDCDAGDPTVFHGAVEQPGDGVDSDCATGELCFTDADNDGARLDSTVASPDDDCDDLGEGVAADPIDCDDANSAISPLDAEIADNGVDEDCDLVDHCYVDADDDGARTAATTAGDDLSCTGANEGQSGDPIDCADGNPNISPFASDVPDNGIDEDCDLVDDCWTDADNDGSRLETSQPGNDLDCTDPSEGRSTDPIDCNDADSSITSSGGVEIPADGVDQDCDGGDLCHDDADDDGNRAPTATRPSTDLDCTDPNEADDAEPIDCNDADGQRFFGNVETVDNGKDNDCDSLEACYADADNDNNRHLTNTVETSIDLQCDDANEGATGDPIDCNDADPLRNSFAAEITGDELDQNCDGNETCFADLDGDGDRGPTTVVSVGDVTCDAAGEAQLSDPVDCNDASAAQSSGAPEVVGNNIDNDCDGFEACYTDGDNDGARLTSSFVAGDLDCTDANEGLASDPIDCDDTTNTRSPLLTEIVGNEVDNDCSAGAGESCWLDADSDGTRNDGVLTIVSADTDCDDAQEGETVDLIDCDETRASVSPLDPDLCGNGLDDDCDGMGDWDSPGVGGFLDDDNDNIDHADEVAAGTSDCDDDSDNDGLADDVEAINDTDPLDGDSDGDTVGDLVEVGPDVLDPPDTDADDLIDALDDDDDDDGIPTITEENATAGDDVDGDLVPNRLDLDSDFDGHTDAIEWVETSDALGDEDGDGDPDFLDLDSDDDEVPDEHELGGRSAPAVDTDTDNDGLVNRIDVDDDGDTLPTALEESQTSDGDPRNDNFDGDGTLDYLDTDDDGDRVPTASEGTSPTGLGHRDTDGDLAADYIDVDDDNDGILTTNEDPNGNGLPLDDNTDGDALPNYRDADDDGDGIATLVEGASDFEGDGIANYLDTDSDDDGYTDAVEGVSDTNADGAGGYLDFDSDDDDVADSDELNADSDGDGEFDRVDTDDDGDDVPTATENYNGGTPLDDDTDGDGRPDYLDVDDDADEVNTTHEADGGLPVDLDTDGDGTPNYLDADDDGDTLLTRGEEPMSDDGAPRNDDSDGDGIDDYLDADDDDDGVDTLCEVTTPEGTTSHLDGDTDNDTILDGVEWFNFLSSALPDADYEDLAGESGTCTPALGGGSSTGFTCLEPWDRDGDGVHNALDSDDDGDGLSTVLEGSDDLDCSPALVSGAGADGIPNWLDYDSDNDGAYDCSAADASGGDGIADGDGDTVTDFVDCEDSGCAADSDADGLLNCDLDFQEEPLEPDSDGDGLLDGDEVGRDLDGAPFDIDTDGDGTPNRLDPDDDGDGVDTAVEAGFDCTFALVLDPVTLMYDRVCPDGSVLPHDIDDMPNTDADTGGAWPFEPDEIPDYLDDDDDGDGNPTFDEGDGDVDGDDLVNYLDPVDFDGPLADADGDGLTNETEGALGTDAYDADSDADGVNDADEGDGDSDSDGTADPLDADDDDDGIPSADEGDLDLDGDGVPNRLDDDSDGDGVSDAEEGGEADSDCDGILDWGDPDETDGACAGGSDTGGGDKGAGCGCDTTSPQTGWILALAGLGLVRRRRS